MKLKLMMKIDEERTDQVKKTPCASNSTINLTDRSPWEDLHPGGCIVVDGRCCIDDVKDGGTKCGTLMITIGNDAWSRD